MLPRPLVIAIAVIITLAWAANVTIGFIDPDRSVPGLNTIFGIVVGSVFALDTARAGVRKVGKMFTPTAPPPDDPGSTP
jgi:hypothetical protein